MGLRGPQPTGKTTGVIRLKKTTLAAIRAQSASLGISQSEIVDRWRIAYQLFRQTVPHADKVLEAWKESENV